MTPLVLASGSVIRRQILEGAGVPFQVQTSGVDEDAIKAASLNLGPSALAVQLAEAKARAVTVPENGLVLGADQILSLEGSLYDKARSREEARERLSRLRGRTHILHSGLAAVRNGKTIWTHSQDSYLTVRDFSDAFLDQYMEIAGGELTASVGAYAFEGLGAQIFEKIEGDYYAILGLPLLPVLSLLRREGVIMA
ncbi:Maf family protein [Hyphobacterium sp.]|uniref:Maf family protein n=1 Tax=Hyphobacterium sp. TaxID=2004662 RepID=UPI00374A2726